MAEERHALVVATNRYDDTRLPPLNAPRQDASALKRVLGDGDIGAFAVQIATNLRIQALRKTLEAFFAHRDRDDLLLVHFSCHGLKDETGQLYLAASDTEVDLLKATALDADWLRQLMNECRSEKIAIFLDCCFGGAFAAGMVHRVGVDSPGIKEHLSGSGRVVITASNAVQYAFENGNRVGSPEPSVFTKALVDGLRTGEADRNQDGLVSVNELFEYLADKVREMSPAQTPTKWEFNNAGDWTIAKSDRTPTISLQRLPPDLQALLAAPDTVHHLAAIVELQALVGGADADLLASVRLAVDGLAKEDSIKVSTAAKNLLVAVEAAEQAQTERRAAEQAETERQAADGAAAQGAEADRLAAVEAAAAAAAAKEQAEAAQRAESERQAAEGAASTAAEQAAAEQAAAERAAAERAAAADAERRAAIQAEADRRAAEEAAAVAAAAERADVERREAELAAAAAASAAAREAARIRREKERRRKIIGIGALAGVIAVATGGAFAALGCLGGTCAGSATPSPSGPVDSPVDETTGAGSIVPVPGLDPETSIVFSVGGKELWAGPPTGSPARLATEAGTQTEPFWSPDRTQIVFRGPDGLALAKANGDPDGTLTDQPGDTAPVWSHHSSTIAFASTRSSRAPDLFSIPATVGATPEQLTDDPALDWDPSWSPKDDRLVFASTRTSNGKAGIFFLTLSDHDVQPLTDDPDGIYDDPAWSPDGAWIAATRKTTPTGKKVLWLIPADGSGPGKPITDSTETEHDPAWSPDSRYLAIAQGNTNPKIVIVDLDGTEIGSFGEDGVANLFPDWR